MIFGVMHNAASVLPGLQMRELYLDEGLKGGEALLDPRGGRKPAEPGVSRWGAEIRQC
jgi:hypothetical protein